MPGPTFPVVLLDLDHTLFDFEASKRAAFVEVLAEAGYDDGLDHLELFGQGERPLWAQLEAGGLGLDSLNDRRFELLVDNAALEADPGAMAASYLRWLGSSGGLLPGARSLLDHLNEHCTLALVSNGYSEVQRARLENFDLGRYFDAVVISSEINVAKPDPAFFEAAFRQLDDPPGDQVLMVGDSLTSDMAGAANFGLAACWYNPDAKPLPQTPSIDFVVRHLDEISEIVL